MSYLYHRNKSAPRFTVGAYAQCCGTWEPESSYDTQEEAMNRVLVLNHFTRSPNTPAQDVNAELLSACVAARDFVGTQNGTPEGLLIYQVLAKSIARAEAAQTPKTHEGHNASRAVREASE